MGEVDSEPRWIRDRRRAIFALLAAGILFFVFWIVFDYALAIHYGYGTGFGDGLVDRRALVLPRGHGFYVDILLLTATVAVDVVLVLGWLWLLPKLESPEAPDDPLVPLPADAADSLDDESWFIVPIPRIARGLTTMALVLLVWLALCGAAILPTVLIRYGWYGGLK